MLRETTSNVLYYKYLGFLNLNHTSNLSKKLPIKCLKIKAGKK